MSLSPEKIKERNERDERLMAMGEMAARISHEIKTLSAVWNFFCPMLLSGKLKEAGKKKYFIMFSSVSKQ